MPLPYTNTEADPAWCHRSAFAAWWFAQTGKAVEELDVWPTGQDSLRPTQERLF